MQFDTPVQQGIHEKVAGFMKELFGEMATANDERPAFGLRFGSAWVNVWVAAWGDDDAVISIRSWLTTGTELTVDLARYLFTANNGMRFGAFGIDQVGDIFFEHSIVGSTATKSELRTSVIAVSATADEYDDEIVSRFGGVRMSDRQD